MGPLLGVLNMLHFDIAAVAVVGMVADHGFACDILQLRVAR